MLVKQKVQLIVNVFFFEQNDSLAYVELFYFVARNFAPCCRSTKHTK